MRKEVFEHQMKITIRDYQDSDRDICRSLWGELARHHAEIYGDPSIAGNDPGRGFERYMTNAHRRGTWVAEVEGQAVACAGLILREEEGEIEPVIVSAQYRGKGIGTALVQHVAEQAKRLGVRFLSIRPVARNEEAIRLFVRLGFNLVGYIDLFQDLHQSSDRQWKPGIMIHGNGLRF